MAKNNITQFDATDANNTDIKSIDISEGMAPSNVNNALRALMATLADLNAGTTTLTAPSGVNITATTAIKTPAIQFTDGDAAISIADGGGVTANNFSSSSVNIDGGAIDGITLGTNSAVTQAVIDNINIDGTTIGHTSDTDLLTLTSGLLTVAGEVSMTTLDIGGTDVTATATELNIMDGVTATTSELNIMDGVTSTTTEINLLDGVTSTTTELNITDGSTSVGTTAVAGADGIVTNDSGTMRHTSVDTFDTYLAATSKTLTNKTIDADNNTVSNIEVDNLKSGVLDTDLSSVSSSHDTIPSAKATKDFIETSATASATSASASATSATASATSATAAATSATAAASSASAASTSESNSQTSANSAAASALLAAGAFDSFDDKYLGTMADNDTASSASTTGTFSSGGSQITVASASGIEVGQLITGTNIATGTNVIKIDGTTINISEATTGAGSGTSLTFTGHGVFGNFNSSIDGPATDNDNGTLATGMLYFNTTDGEMRVYDGANWIAASASGSASFTKYKYVATASQTTFSGTDANSATLSYVIGNIIVALNGVILDATDFTATSGTSVVLGSGAAASDELTIYAFKSFTVADAVQASTGGTFGGNVVFNGTTTGLDLNGTEFILDADGDTSITSDTDDQIDIRVGGSDQVVIATGSTAFKAPDGGSRYALNGMGNSDSAELSLYNSSDAQKVRIGAGVDTFFNGGHVGIGTTSPNKVSGHTMLSINTGTASQYAGLDISTADTVRSALIANNSGTFLETRTSIPLVFSTNTTERMRIDSSGNVGIGTTSPSQSIETSGNIFINSSGNPFLEVKTSGAGNNPFIRIKADTNYWDFQTLFSNANDELDIRYNGNSKVIIDKDGRVGIGATPTAQFAHNLIQVGNQATLGANAALSTTGQTFLTHNLYYNTDGNLRVFNTNNANEGAIIQIREGTFTFSNSDATTGTPTVTERAKINSDGKLHLQSNTTAEMGLFENGFGSYGSTGVKIAVNRTSSGGNYNFLTCTDSAASVTRLLIEDGGTVKNATGTYGSTSDEKLKENISDSGSQWDDIKAIRVRKFSLKEEKLDKPNMIGVIAQEAEASGMTGLVTDDIDRDADGEPTGTTTKSFKYSILYMKAVKALQEAMARIETLEAKVTALEAK